MSELSDEQVETSDNVVRVVQPGRLTYGLGCTLNLGDFNNLRVHVEYEESTDVLPGETKKQSFDRLAAWVEARFNEKIEEEVRNLQKRL